MSIGGVNHEAIAAIENACLDVKAKALGVPVCALFGGPFRDRVNLYWSHCASFRVWRRDYFEQELGLKPLRTLDDIKELGAEVKARGFKALKTNPLPLRPSDPPFMPGFRMMPNFLSRHPDAKMIRSIHDVLAAFRAGAGDDMGLMLDLNFSQRTEGFIRIAKAVEDLKLTWLECDIHDPEALATVRRSTSTPIASLETIHGLAAFRPYLERYACDVAIVDVQWNGLWESVRAASLADAFEVDCAPHNFAGHLASMISAHFCASIPNYRIMEYDVDEVPWRNDLVTHRRKSRMARSWCRRARAGAPTSMKMWCALIRRGPRSRSLTARSRAALCAADAGHHHRVCEARIPRVEIPFGPSTMRQPRSRR
jgi:L-alanine-DL-glutamate epimerase and related enzymes of enolase superfamily